MNTETDITQSPRPSGVRRDAEASNGPPRHCGREATFLFMRTAVAEEPAVRITSSIWQCQYCATKLAKPEQIVRLAHHGEDLASKLGED